MSAKGESGRVTAQDLPSVLAKLKALRETLEEEEISAILGESDADTGQEIDFEAFLRVLLFLMCTPHFS